MTWSDEKTRQSRNEIDRFRDPKREYAGDDDEAAQLLEDALAEIERLSKAIVHERDRCAALATHESRLCKERGNEVGRAIADRIAARIRDGSSFDQTCSCGEPALWSTRTGFWCDDCITRNPPTPGDWARRMSPRTSQEREESARWAFRVAHRPEEAE